MTSEFILRQGAGQKLEFAFNRNGCGAQELEWLSSGENMKMVQALARGEFELKPVERLLPHSKVVVDIDPTLTKEGVDAFLVSNRQGLYVPEEFDQLFKSEEQVPLPSQLEISKFEFLKLTDWWRLRKLLPENFIFGAYEVRALLATLLAKQKGGAEGVFNTDLQAHVFFVKVDEKLFAVVVKFWPEGKDWTIEVRSNVQDIHWKPRGVVFSRN